MQSFTEPGINIYLLLTLASYTECNLLQRPIQIDISLDFLCPSVLRIKDSFNIDTLLYMQSFDFKLNMGKQKNITIWKIHWLPVWLITHCVVDISHCLPEFVTDTDGIQGFR